MARIFYSMAGEGRGHAARVRTVVEHLRDEHELVLFASDDAYEFLAGIYSPSHEGSNVRLLRIPGIRFHYTAKRLDLTKTIATGLHYGFCELPKLVAAFRRRIQAEQPDLVISDFEPALPRAALREGVPALAIDHQHVLQAYDLRDLPRPLQWHAWLMSWAVWLYYPKMQGILTSSFYSPPLKPGWEHVQQVGPLIRPEIAAALPTTGNYLLSYLRANTPEPVIDCLESLQRPIKIYGVGERPPRGRLTFCPIHETVFVQDLAGCEGVICAAGNQLLGESLFLGKPVLAVPETQHHEQRINAYYLKQMGVGDWSILEDLTPAILHQFLQNLERFRSRLTELQGRLNGTPDVISAVTAFLPTIAPSDRASDQIPL